MQKRQWISWLDRADKVKVAGTLRRAVRRHACARIPGGRHMECAYYFDSCRLCRKKVLTTLAVMLPQKPRVLSGNHTE
jgi:hypothetical protein